MATPVKPIVVEFIGLPGGGKTTVCRQAAERLSADGLHVVQRKEYYEWLRRCSLGDKIKVRAWDYLKRLPIAVQFLRYMSSRCPHERQPFSYGHKIALNHAYFERFLRATRPEVCLLEQWTLQSVWSLGVTCQETEVAMLMPIARAIVAADPHLYIYSSLPPEIAAQRIASRSHGASRFDKRARTEIEQQLRQFHRLFEPILQAIEAQKRPLLCLNTTEPVEEQVNQVVNWITKAQ